MAFLNRVSSYNKMLRLTGYSPRRRLAEGVTEMTRWIMEIRAIAPQPSIISITLATWYMGWLCIEYPG